MDVWVLWAAAAGIGAAIVEAVLVAGLIILITELFDEGSTTSPTAVTTVGYGGRRGRRRDGPVARDLAPGVASSSG